MLDVIEKLLVLQDRDRKISKLKEELMHIPVERQQHESRLSTTQTALESAKHRIKQLESDRKKLELDVEARKQLIERYGLQQFQTKKNEEYRALAHEIDTCRQAIVKLDDQQLEIMEQMDAAQKELVVATQAAAEAKKVIDARLTDIAAREQNLKKELAQLESNRSELASVVDEDTRNLYERLFRIKGHNVVVGIQHGVCGGCHMTLNRQVVVTCKQEQEIVTCLNCGRILYYTRDMDLAVAE
jgi:predicted  nucleic acid-binding Zn-ribbon protein